MPTTTKRPRKALAEANPDTLVNSTIPEDLDVVPVKKSKKAQTSKTKEPKISAANPPAFLTEVTLPGEEDVSLRLHSPKLTVECRRGI